MENKNYISVLFSDEHPMLQAVERLKESNEDIVDVMTPFPVHGLDEALSMKRTRIPLAGFIAGATGAILGFGFQAWVFTKSYPLVFGGKPLLSVPSFIPVTFECTILFAALAMAAALLIKSKLKPVKDFEPVDDRITDDCFAVLVKSSSEPQTDMKRVESILKGIQTLEIKI